MSSCTFTQVLKIESFLGLIEACFWFRIRDCDMPAKFGLQKAAHDFQTALLPEGVRGPLPESFLASR
jgi:hypothetical protein